jgi:hypothetical protein
MKKVTTLLVLWTMAISIGQAHEISVDQFMGSWKVVAIAGLEEISGGPPLAKELRGKILKISPGGMEMNVKEVHHNWYCTTDNPFVIQKIDIATFLREYVNAPLEELTPPAPYPKLKKQLIMLDTDACLTVLWLSRQYIEFVYGGVFAIAKRMR